MQYRIWKYSIFIYYALNRYCIIYRKFSQEFVSSADGKVAADNLLATIRKSKEHIHAQLKAKEDKVNTLLELVEQDPEIKKRLDEVMLSKSK